MNLNRLISPKHDQHPHESTSILRFNYTIMEFSPSDGFCCPSVDRFPSRSNYELRISKFMAWVKSLPFTHEGSKRYVTSTVAPLKDQPFVIKIVEVGYAFMFHGAFAPRYGEGDTGGFDRIPYFDLITSDFKETQLLVYLSHI